MTYPFPLPSPPYMRHALIVEELLKRGYYDAGWKPESREAYRTLETEMNQRDLEQRTRGAEAHASDLVERNRDLESRLTSLREGLRAAVHTFRSYQYGNSAPDLAKEAADHLETLLAEKKES